jgi:DNA repair protein RecN (Recombination protein N)
MLSHIHIRDFAIVDQLELDLSYGMTALTGETGAGKSILVDALGLALGDRADIGVIRHGAERAEINIGFDLDDAPAASQWLEEQDLASSGECFIRRIITQEGRSKGYINGRPVPMQSLKELGEMLVDIHGQHEHQSLLKRDTQRQLLDDYAGNGELCAALEKCFREWKNKSSELASLRGAAADRSARLDLLRFQVTELENLNLVQSEIDELNEEHSRLANAGRLLETCQGAVAALYEGDEATIHDQLSRIHGELDPLCDIDPSLCSVRDMLNEALIQVSEAVDELRSYADRLDLDPNRLQWVEQRLAAIHDLSRKHHVSPGELPELLENLKTELETLDHADERLGELQDEIDALRQTYDNLARQLGRKRREAAKVLDQHVTAIIQKLGMPGARFEIAVQTNDQPVPTAIGLEQVEFQVSTNPGQPLKPLNKVASGGELSRFSLAIQVVLAQTTRIPTLIYDEVDTGIGGAVAEVVGQQLRTLGAVRQVLCVTHLPQVAAQAHRHLQVSKQTQNGETRTKIAVLSDEQRVEETARMLGGIRISEQTRAHAAEMIEGAQKTKKTTRPPKRSPKKKAQIP